MYNSENNNMFNNYNIQQNNNFYPNNNYQNYQMNIDNFIEYKYSIQNEGLNINNYYEPINGYLLKVYILKKEDFEKLLQPNYSAYLQSQGNYLPFLTSINNTVNCIISNNSELYFVKKEFFSMNQLPFNEMSSVNIYKKEDRIILFFPQENNKSLELKIKNESNIQNNLINENPIEKTLKKLILLDAFEKEFLKLMKKNIEDEYDLKSYYLINKNIIDQFKNEHISFKQLYNVNFDLSYKGYIKNMNNIMQMNPNIFNNDFGNYQLDNKYRYENNYAPLFNMTWNNTSYPSEFIVIPDDLFDLFYTDFIQHTITKENFKYNMLIGNDVIFVQDKTFNHVFNAYKINTQNRVLEIICSFNFNEENIFYREANQFIKGKGLDYYLNARQMDLKNIKQFKQLIANNNVIGQYIIFKEITLEKQDKSKIREEMNKNIYLLIEYNNFIQKINDLQPTNIELNNINDVVNNLSNLNKIECLIIYGKNLNLIKDRLHFDEIKNLLYLQNSPNYNQEEDKIINIIMNEQNQRALNELINQDMIFDGMNSENFVGQPVFHFINLNLIKLINDNTEFLNACKNREAFLFVNNNIYYLYYQNTKQLYKINTSKVGSEFSIEEETFEQGLSKIYENLKKLIKDEENQKQLMKSCLKLMQKPEDYYCINQKYMNDFKKVFNYTIIQKNPNNYKIWKEYMKKNGTPPSELLNKALCFFSETLKVQNINVDIPKNFVIIKKEIFDSILEELNINNKDKSYQIAFGSQRIIIHDEYKPEIYLIYIKMNFTYELDYIIDIHNTNFVLSNLFENIDSNKSIDEIFAYDYGINMTDKSPQSLVFQKKNIGNIYVIREKEGIKMKEPEHCLGLENIGATCYMNATIQCFCHVSNLKNYFLNKQKVLKDMQNKHCPLTKEFYNLINNLWKESFEGKSFYAPVGFKDVISQMNPLFKGIAANDSKDLILFLFENIHNEINNPEMQQYQIQNATDNPDLQEFRNDYYPKNSSIIIKTFYFEHQNELKCLKCGDSRVSYNIYNILVFPLEKVREYMVNKYPTGFGSVTLEDCFKHYQHDETLIGNNKIYCNNCGQMAEASNINKMYSSPEVLTIILNRGKGLEFNVYFEYPLYLNIDNYVVDKTITNNNYELICVLTHLGPSGMSGHFIAFCKSPVDGNWYLYNDAQVKKCDDPRNQDNTVIEGLPYVLFYQKCYKNQNKIILYIKYNDKECYIEVEKEIIISELIKRLNAKFGIPLNLKLCLKENNNSIQLMPDNKISQYPTIKDGSRIIAEVF